MSARQGQTVYLDVAGYAYLERPIFDLMLNGINVDGPGGLVVGVPIKLGPQVVTWRDAGTGESFKAANVPELNTVNPQFRYLGFHIYPDNTVELLPGRYWPERTERGEAIIRAREQKHGK